jgi:ELWxxDGT repeat protein
VGPSLYFVALPQDNQGEQLFRTDGTTAGTVALLPALLPPADSFMARSVASILPYAKGVALVTETTIYGPSAPSYPVYELWVSDGAPESTLPLLSTPDRLSLLGVAAGRVLFGRRPENSFEDELWASDGTAAGTALLSRLAGAGKGSRITNLGVGAALADPPAGTSSADAGGRIFFAVVDDLAGEELWASDGTAAGTRRVTDLFAGAAGSHPTYLTPYRACVVFAATDGHSGHELWASDGRGAWRVSDVAPGSRSSSPGQMTAAGGFLYFAADDGTHGRELFAVPTAALDARCSGAPPPPPPGEWLTSAEVPGFRFKVQLGTGDTAVAGTQVDCVAATLCVAGARAGRAEVLARIVGPKPNGRLWPTLIALTPTEAQVWVEQVATGEIRYYLLPAAGGDTLAGMIDRAGFASQPGSAAVHAEDTAGVAADPSGWLTTPELPGFRFRVQLFLGDGRPQPIRMEPCLAETLCVSGAVAGRPEVFVRVTGKRPNGRRWVAMGRLTTARVEIDVEQVAGGEVRHYGLPGLSPASDRIEGLLDRVGFAP